ncbi:MAG: thiolase family protein [Dehalococcoidia bacterium]
MASLKDKYCIAGVGNTAYGRLPGHSALSLTVEAIRAAIEDCGIEKQEIDAVLTKYPTSQFQSLFSTRVAQSLGIVPKVTATIDQAGASNIGLITYAMMCIENGLCSAAVCSYGDNPLTGNRSNYSRPRGEDAAYGFFGAPSGYAMVAQRYRYEFGLTEEQLSTVPITFHKHASLNPNAQFRNTITLEEYQHSRYVAEPLHLLDCCPVTDGAAAVVVTTAERARTLKKPSVYVMGFGQGHPSWDIAQRETLTTSGAAIAGPTALRMAGITAKDVDVAELYDCFSIVPIITLEDYGFCKKGEGPDFIQNGRIDFGGEIPLNTAGGLLSETGMPGMQLITEAVRQLRGECGDRQVADAEIAMVSNQGGIMTTHASMVLRR